MPYDTYDLIAHTDQQIERPRLRFGNSKNLYPSEASVSYIDEFGDKVVAGTCHRKSYYRIKGVEGSPTNARTQLIFDLGKAVERSLIEYWKQMGIWVDNNVEFQTSEFGFPIKGELDCILSEPPDGKQYLVEVKSFYGFDATKEIMGNYAKKGAPKISQLLQTLIYVYLFRKQFYCGRMVYMARDETSNRRTFKIELEQEGETFWPKVDGEVLKWFSVNDIFRRYRTLQDYINKDELPPRDFEMNWSDEKIEDFYKKGKISESKYKEHQSNLRVKDGTSRMKNPQVKTIGCWECRYCPYMSKCYNQADI